MPSSILRWLIRLLLMAMICAVATFFYLMHQRKQPQYLAARAEEAIQAGDDDKAEIYLRNLLQRVPDNTDAKIEVADILARRAQRDGQPASNAADSQARALQLLAEAAAQRPNDTDLQTKLMMAYAQSGRSAAAAAVAEKLAQAGSKDPMALQLAASKAVSTRDYAQAEELLARLATVQPDPPLDVLLLRAQLYSKQGAKAKPRLCGSGGKGGA